jgi:hypothetical protein
MKACNLEKEFQRKVSMELDDLEKNSKIFHGVPLLSRSSSIIEAEGEKKASNVSFSYLSK